MVFSCVVLLYVCCLKYMLVHLPLQGLYDKGWPSTYKSYLSLRLDDSVHKWPLRVRIYNIALRKTSPTWLKYRHKIAAYPRLLVQENSYSLYSYLAKNVIMSLILIGIANLRHNKGTLLVLNYFTHVKWKYIYFSSVHQCLYRNHKEMETKHIVTSFSTGVFSYSSVYTCVHL